MNYDLIQECQGRFSVDRMCKALDMSRSGYYAWKGRPPSERERENRELAFHIKVVHRETDATYGTPRITKELNEAGIPCGENRIARIKQEIGLKAIAAPRKFRCTTKASSDAVVSPDLTGVPSKLKNRTRNGSQTSHTSPSEMITPTWLS